MCSLLQLRKTWFLVFFFILINLPLYYVFQAPPSLWNFFQLSSTCLVRLEIGTYSLYIMLNNNFNSLTPWDSQNPYDPRLNHKQALSGRLKKNENNNFQHYNIPSACEVKDETSTNRIYVSLVFYHTVRSWKILVKKELQVFLSEGGGFEWFCTEIPLGL
jgi:hypothetical protein